MKTNQTQDPIRPPVVALMGHIDHGKTSLLDRIRQSHLQKGEAGGITQHISAYQVVIGKQKITFVDTPGHKVFEKMRGRGAMATDLVVLVIAADEGIKPQTQECLDHIKKAGVPFLIALNKIDLPNANEEEIKNKLTQFGVVTEDRGGETVLVSVSAKTGQGIDELLEMIILLAQMEELAFLPEAPFKGVVVESYVDRQKGTLVNVIVRQGKLLVGQEIASEGEKVKVKAIFDDLGRSIKEALISQPVAILGFTSQPSAGSIVYDSSLEVKQPHSKDQEDKKTNEQRKALMKLIVKADTQGTLEALLNSLPKEDLVIIETGVGQINESDVFLASLSQAEIIGFNVQPSSSAIKLAKIEGIFIKTELIIYQLLQHIEERIKALKNIEEEKSIFGEAEIVANFSLPEGRIAGAKVLSGEIKDQTEVFIVKQDKTEKKTKIVSLQRGKEKVSRVEKGREFGAMFFPAVDFSIGDVIKYRQS